MESDLVQHKELDNNSLAERILEILRSERCRTVRDLIDALEKEEKSVPVEQIRDRVLSLEKDGRISLTEQVIPSSFTIHLTRNYFDNIPLWIALVTTVSTLVAIYAINSESGILQSIIRIITSGVTLFFLPGYGVLTLFSDRNMSSVERVAASVMLSLVMSLILFLTIENLPIVAGRDTMIIGVTITGFLLVLFGTHRQFTLQQTHGRLITPAENGNKVKTQDGRRNPQSSIGIYQPHPNTINGDASRDSNTTQKRSEELDTGDSTLVPADATDMKRDLTSMPNTSTAPDDQVEKHK